MSKKPALGRGFDGLIPAGVNVGSVTEPGERIRQIKLEEIVQNPDQPRREFDEDALQELAQSIKRHGIIQPLVLTPDGSRFRIVAGERRYRSAKIAGLNTVPAVVRNHQVLEELEIALVENVQRVDLSPLEQALSISRLRDQFSLSLRQIAEKLGKAEATISNTMRLLQLPNGAVEALKKGDISEGHARAILALKHDTSAQEELLKAIIAKQLSVRDAEAFVKEYKRLNEQKNSSISTGVMQSFEAVQANGYKAKIEERKRGGRIILSFNDEDEALKILNRLK